MQQLTNSYVSKNKQETNWKQTKEKHWMTGRVKEETRLVWVINEGHDDVPQ
jgi:hypothetical protein